jgi:hypothetical protein
MPRAPGAGPGLPALPVPRGRRGSGVNGRPQAVTRSAMRSTLYTGGTAPYPARHPENSGGEAATFPKALDTTNKEESICMTVLTVGVSFSTATE